jgi:UDP-N-acetylmuramyl pentapeptide synthase
VAAEVRAGDVVLVKGSLGMGMSAIIKALNDAAPVAAATGGGRGA